MMSLIQAARNDTHIRKHVSQPFTEISLVDVRELAREKEKKKKKTLKWVVSNERATSDDAQFKRSRHNTQTATPVHKHHPDRHSTPHYVDLCNSRPSHHHHHHQQLKIYPDLAQDSEANIRKATKTARGQNKTSHERATNELNIPLTIITVNITKISSATCD